MFPLASIAVCPRLLVSVRSAVEAIAALDGGADVIDVKEPSRGPMGPADAGTITAVVRVVAGRAPVTAAAGELIDFLCGRSPPGFNAVTGDICSKWPESRWATSGIAVWKFGLAGCRSRKNWRAEFKSAAGTVSKGAQAVVVAYADWQAADSPPPDEVLSVAVDCGCHTLLVDTWEKSGGTLLDHLPPNELRGYIARVHRRGLAIAAAGSLSLESMPEVAALGPDWIAVRGAACHGGRDGVVLRERVAAIRAAVHPQAASRFLTTSNPISRII
jgi:uncharacterized protein (UPF0264 family)